MSGKKTTPLPGTPVKGSTTGRPIMVLMDLLGRRWMLSPLGHDLSAALAPLHAWADKWRDELAETDTQGSLRK